MFKSFLWACLEKGGQFFVQFFSIIIFSRYLSPEEYGVFGIMAVFIALSEALIDPGFGGAIVQKKDVRQNDINTLFVTNLIISLSLYAILFLLSPPIAEYYKLPELSLYIRVLGLTIVFYSLTIVHTTLLQKELKFRKTAIITVVSYLTAMSIAFLIAHFGGGIWALIYQPLIMSVVMSLLLWLTERRRILIQFSKDSFNGMWSFGSKLLFANILNTLYSNFSTSMIPIISSVRVSGLYYQAARINTIPTSVLQMVIDKAAFPILTKETCRDNVLIRARSLNGMINTLIYPLFPILSLFSIEIISIVLGKQWINAADFLSILAWGGWGYLYQVLSRNLFKSVGDTKTIFKVDLIKTLFGLTVLLLSLIWGMTFMILGITAAMYLGAFLYIYELHHKLGYDIRTQIEDILKPFCASFVAYICAYPFVNQLSSEWYYIFIAVPIVIIYAIISVLIKNQNIILILKKVGCI